MVIFKNYTKRMFYLDESFHNFCTHIKLWIMWITSWITCIYPDFSFFFGGQLYQLIHKQIFPTLYSSKIDIFLRYFAQTLQYSSKISSFTFSEIVPENQFFILNFGRQKGVVRQ